MTNEKDLIDELRRRIRLAREVLLSEHVQKNKHLLGVLGRQDIDDAVAMLTDRTDD